MRQLLVLLSLAGAAQADVTHTVALEAVDGTRIEIATLTVAADDSYTVDMRDAAFGEYFLSMRPFKCLAGPEKHWCHVPYPYAIRRNLSADLVDLEYDFMFLWKGATDYGINFWNGVYYVLERDGDRLIGRMHEIDMGGLAIPPDAGNMRPVETEDLEPADPSGHWLPYLIIE